MQRHRRSSLADGLMGMGAGVAATLVQTAVGLAIDRLFLPGGEDNNIAPRLANRFFRKRGYGWNGLRDWIVGTGFHLGYGAGWGLVYGLARRWSGLPGPVLGPALGVVLYVLAFSRVGIGTLIGAERHPEQRDPRKELSLIAVAGTFALAVAALFGLADATSGRSGPQQPRSRPRQPVPDLFAKAR